MWLIQGLKWHSKVNLGSEFEVLMLRMGEADVFFLSLIPGHFLPSLSTDTNKMGALLVPTDQ